MIFSHIYEVRLEIKIAGLGSPHSSTVEFERHDFQMDSSPKTYVYFLVDRLLTSRDNFRMFILFLFAMDIPEINLPGGNF